MLTTKASRRRFQFRIRSLLIVFVGISVPLGIYAAWRDRAQRQATFVKQLSEEGKCLYDHEVHMEAGLTYSEKFPWNVKSPYPQFLHDWLGKDFLHDVVAVKLWNPVTGHERRKQTVERMRRDLPCLRRLTIHDFSPTAEDLEQIVGIRSLRSMDFTFVDVDTELLPIIGRARQLHNLELWNHDLTDADMQHLTSLTELRRLRVRGQPLGEQGAPWLASFTRLETLIAEENNLDARAAVHLAGLTNLKRLYLRDTAFDDAALEHLANLTNLEEIDLSNTNISDEGVLHLAGLVNVQSLKLNGTAITDTSLATLAGLEQLRELELDGTHIRGNGLAALSRLPELRILNLNRTGINDKTLDAFADFPMLATLQLTGTTVSDEGFRTIRWPPKLRSLYLEETCVTQGALDDLLRCSSLSYLSVIELPFDSVSVAKFHAARPKGHIQVEPYQRGGRRDGTPINADY